MRVLGLFLIVAAIVLALTLGLLFASQTTSDSDPAELTGPLATGFFAVTALAASGVVLFVRASALSAPRSSTALQRALVDVLNGRAHVTFSALAADLGVESTRIESLLRDLTAQGVWSGTVSWASGDVYPRAVSEVREFTACPHCQVAVDVSAGFPLACTICGSVTYSIE